MNNHTALIIVKRHCYNFRSDKFTPPNQESEQKHALYSFRQFEYQNDPPHEI